MFPNKTKLLKVLKIIVKLNFLHFFWLLCCKMSVLLEDSVSSWFLLKWYFYIFFFWIGYFKVQIWIFFSFTSSCMVLLQTFCLSVSVTITKPEPMSWFMDSPVNAYSRDFLNLKFSASSFFCNVCSKNIIFIRRWFFVKNMYWFNENIF